MPFKSEKQRRYLWKNEPKIAREWTKAYGSKPVGKKKKEEEKEKIMDEFSFVLKLQRAIKQNLAALSLNVTSGGVDSHEKYKYITGQISALESVLQEISNLLNKKEQEVHDGKVIRIDKDPKPTKG